MNLASKVTIPIHVMAREVGDETVILDLASGTYFGLDAVGARIWQLIASNVALDEVCAILVLEYEVSRDELERDVVSLIETLQSKQLVSLVPPA